MDNQSQVIDEKMKSPSLKLHNSSGFMSAVFTMWHATEQQDLTTSCN